MKCDGMVSRSVFALGCSMTDDNVLHAEVVFCNPEHFLNPGDRITLFDAVRGKDGPTIETEWPEGMSQVTGDVEFKVLKYG